MTRKTALVVDDMATERLHLKRLLEYMGFEVVEANCAESGLRMLERFNPCVVLMDVMMPGTDGFQATRDLKANAETKHLPVIIVSSKDRMPDQVNAVHSGAQELVAKPATKRSLALALIRAKVLDVPEGN